LKKNFFLLVQISVIYLLFFSVSLADIQKKLINKITATKTLSFNFKQKIEGEEENGTCYIKYPLLMKCDYKNLKQKSIISNGRTVAIIKKKYKKIYYYPLKKTPLFIILQKNEILNLVKNNKPNKKNLNKIEFKFEDKKLNNLKIFFDKKSLKFTGWETIDAYSNNVEFIITNVKENEVINDSFFKIPKESEL
tara:strand:+ start:696 stop:1274 length:579 start_codon:yes stop_codon:yes gene_type:complete